MEIWCLVLHLLGGSTPTPDCSRWTETKACRTGHAISNSFCHRSSAYLCLPRSLLLLFFYQVDFLNWQKFAQHQRVHYMKQTCLALFIIGMSGWGNPIGLLLNNGRFSEWQCHSVIAGTGSPSCMTRHLIEIGKTQTWKKSLSIHPHADIKSAKVS